MLQFRTKPLIAASVYFFGREKKVDFHSLNKTRNSLFVDNLQYQYRKPDAPHQDLMFCETIYGRNCYIVALTPDSRESSIFVSSAIKTMNPTQLILGNFNSSAVKTIYPFSQSQRLLSQLSLKYETKLQPKDLFCRSVLAPVVFENVRYNKDWFEEHKTMNILMADHTNLRLTVNDYLTATNVVNSKQFVKLSFGTPSDSIVFEDIMLNYGIDEFRSAFQRIIGRIRNNNGQFAKYEYSPGILIDQLKIQGFKERMLYDKEITFITSLLNTHASASQKVMLLVDRSFAAEIADNVHKTAISPKSVYRNYLDSPQSKSYSLLSHYLQQNNRQGKIDELLQKLAILCFTKNNALEIQLILEKKNIFQSTIFKKIFANIPIDTLIQRYRAIKQSFTSQVFNIIYQRIENIKQYREERSLLLSLPQQIKTQHQRSIDFPYYFQPMNKLIKQRALSFNQQLSQKMDEIVELQKLPDDREIYNTLKEGQVSREGIIFMSKLLGEARARLMHESPEFRKIAETKEGKFPTYHFQGFRHFYKEQLGKEMLGKKKKSREILSKINEKIRLENNGPNGGRLIEMSDPEEIDRFIKEKGQDVKQINLNFSADGKIEPEFQDDSAANFEEMKKAMEKDPFFEEIIASFEEEMKQEQELKEAKQSDQPYSEFKDDSIKMETTSYKVKKRQRHN